MDEKICLDDSYGKITDKNRKPVQPKGIKTKEYRSCCRYVTVTFVIIVA